MSIPKEPRQQMINMMYLVLTALLAMNVSKEVLDAFGLVREGLANTNVAIDGKNQLIYKQFESSLKDDAVKAQFFYDKAQEAKQYSQELYDYIDGLKETLITEGGGYKEEGVPSSGLKKLDDIYVGTRIMVAEDAKDGKGYELQQKILEYRDKFLDIVDATDEYTEMPGTNRSGFEKTLTLNAIPPEPKRGAKQKSWEAENFDQRPLIAALTILEKFQNDVKSAESSTIDFLIKNIGATDFKVDKLAAKVIAPSSYLSQGKEYTADIFVAASSSTQQPDVFIGKLDLDKIPEEGGELLVYNSNDENDIPIVGDYETLDVKGGEGKMVRTASGVGEKEYEGVIRVKQPKGGYDFYPFKAKYEVAPPSGFAVSADKMNVLYIGVPNPITISVSGAKDSEVYASISSGSLSRASGIGKYTATVNSPGTTNVNVTATINEERKNLGSMEFRVKRIPDPVPTLGGKLRGGKIQKGTLKAQSGIVPLLENFDFEARFNVISFEMVYSTKGEVFKAEGKGPLLTQTMKGYIDRAKPKDFVFLDEIKVKGPDGVPRRLNAIVFEVI
ncbi:MAG: gliding motility protein GldM [Chitinophagales bacterium]|nr:gliding motility protein GldM [Chitinophagales bacterium]